MRAVAISKFGERGSLVEVPAPDPGDRDLLVRVTAAGVNPVDWKTRDGHNAGDQHFPLILGQDFAGVVERAAEGLPFTEGERVFGIARDHGAYAERTAIPAGASGQPVAKIPDGVSDAEAAALPTAGLTAYAALERLGVERGTTVVILGVTGGVGAIAAQLARERGATVIGIAKSDLDDAKRVGAEIALRADGDEVAAVRGRFPGGVDAVLDLVDDREHIRRWADALKPNGAIVSTIGAADEAFFRERGIAATNLVVTQTPQSSRAGLDELARRVAAGTLDTRITTTVPLEDAVDVLERQKNGEIRGKAIITVRGER